MRIFNRAHVPWFLFVLVATAVSAWLYIGNFGALPAVIRLPSFLIQTPFGHRSVGGTPLGLIFGIVAFGIFIFAGLLGMRKRIVLWRFGTVQLWMRAHIWLTLLTIPLVLFHSGFRMGGAMTIWLWAIYAIVMVSGIYGLALQHQLPRIMKERLQAEPVYEEIPYIRSQLATAAQEMRDSFASALPARTAPGASAAGPSEEFATESTVATDLVAANGERGAAAQSTVEAPAAASSAAPERDMDSEAVLVAFLDTEILPYLSARRGDRLRLGNNRYSEDLFRVVKLRVGEFYRGRIEEIQSWCDERRTLDLQLRLQHWLHAWLFVHVPISYFLILFTAWHAYITLFYY